MQLDILLTEGDSRIRYFSTIHYPKLESAMACGIAVYTNSLAAAIGVLRDHPVVCK